MVLCEMYCREQIVIPEQLPIILKKYAKAVIRTQPYDILRWSAAYFRCLALETTPPVKLRYEPMHKFGQMTREYIRTLVEQLGKGYFVKRKQLLCKWQGLCLPEDQLLDFLSLCRMLKWSDVHWLKVFSVLVASLNETLPDTMRMICEILTEEPEGSPSPIPLWMFRTCYRFLAEIDASDTQVFIDGRKLLCGEVLEDEEDMPEAPQLHKACVFQELLLDEWKSRMKYDTVSIGTLIPSIELTSDSDVVEIDENVSKISSNFKFVGNFDDPTEVLRRAPDFDSVILLLQDELEEAANSIPLDESTIMKCREARKRRLCDANAGIANEAEHAQRMELLKHIGPPWAWLHQFTEHSCPRRSYNFLEIPSSPLDSEDDEEDMSAGSRKTIIHYTEADLVPSELPSSLSGMNLSCSLGTDSKRSLISQILADVICKIGEAQAAGKCSLDNQSMIDVIKDEFQGSPEAEQLENFLEKATENGLGFKDLNELNNYFMCETVKSSHQALDEPEEEETEDRSQVLKECEDPNKIVEIFEASGIEVDNKVLEKQVSQKMILGLVDKPIPVSPDVESVKSIQSDDTTTASMKSAMKTPKTKEQDIQTTSFLERQKERLSKEKEEVDHCDMKEEERMHRSIIPPLPGIGGRVGEGTVKEFLLFIMRRAREQKGLVYPRNWEEPDCPPMVDE